MELLTTEKGRNLDIGRHVEEGSILNSAEFELYDTFLINII